jgi:hypothetical protein
MKNKFLFLIIIFVFLIIGLTGCNSLNPFSSNSAKFVGTWVADDIPRQHSLESVNELTFFSDFTFSSNLVFVNGVYEIKDNKFVLSFNQGSLTSTFDYDFNDDYTVFSLTDSNGRTAFYHKE